MSGPPSAGRAEDRHDTPARRLSTRAQAGSTGLRVLAVLIAVAGLIDPAFAVHRAQPIPVEIRIDGTSAAAGARDRLMTTLAADIVADTSGSPAAAVVIGDAAIPPPLAPGVPVFVVSSMSPGGRNVRVVRAEPPAAVLPGQDAVFAATFEAVGLAGKSSAIELTQEGVRLAHAEHRWTRDVERFTVELRYAPPAAGVYHVAVAAQPIAGEGSDEDNAADVPLVAVARTLRIAIYEPRPSWAAGFVRRALESDPIFAVSSLVRPSRGLAVRTGTPPGAVTAASLAPFDAIVAGAPEELTAADAGALAVFVHERGGALLLLPDRRPAGPYVQLMPPVSFDEAVLERPVALDADGRVALTASEFALPQRLGAGGAAIAGVTLNGAPRAAIASWPSGSGRILFSGALDAWRYRDRDEDGFARFWTGIAANLAAGAAPRLSVTVIPALAAPGEPLAIRATIRPSELGREGPRIVVPAVDAAIIATDGSRRFVRLWPSARPGVFDGAIAAPPAGRYDVRVSSAGGMIADAGLLVAGGVRHPPALDAAALELVSRATGGATTDATDLAPIAAALRRLPKRTVEVTRHPMRSAWWSLAFAAALCGEWFLRRHGGAR